MQGAGLHNSLKLMGELLCRSQCREVSKLHSSESGGVVFQLQHGAMFLINRAFLIPISDLDTVRELLVDRLRRQHQACRGCQAVL